MIFPGNCLQQAIERLLWTDTGSGTTILVSDTEQESCVLFTLQLHYFSLTILCQMQLNPFGHTVYLPVQSCRTEPYREQKVTWHTWSLCFVYCTSSVSTSLFPLVPLEEKTVCWALLSIRAYLTLNFLSCRFGILLVVPPVPPFCDVIFVKQVFESHEKESENVGVCLNAWFSLIPWLNCPLLWSQCIVVYAQVLRRKVTFVWLAGSPPQWTNPAELVHSATTSWPGGIWPLKWLQKECLSPLQRILFFSSIR